MNDKIKGTIWMSVSALSLALMGAAAKNIGKEISTFEKLFLRNLIGVITILFSLRGQKINFFGSSNKSRLFIFYRCFLGLLGSVCYFYAIDNLYLADSTLLNKLSPFFVTIFATIFLKERFKKIQIPIFTLVFAGAILVIKPKFSFDIIPYLVGFLSAIFAGSAYTILRYLRTMENPATLVFWFSTFGTVFMIPPLVINGFSIPNMTQTFYIILMGIFSTVGQLGLASAYKYVSANEISIYQYLSIIFAAIIGFFIWKEIPDIYSIIGGIMILSAAFLNYKFTKN